MFVMPWLKFTPPNVDVNNDIKKAVRKGFKPESRPGARDGRLGTVLVEMSNTDVKGQIMKTKKVLDNHVNDVMKNLRIKNMKNQDQLNFEFSTRQILKMVPGGENWYLAGNGRLNQVRPGGAAPRQQRPHPQPAAAFQPRVPPPGIQELVQPPPPAQGPALPAAAPGQNNA